MAESIDHMNIVNEYVKKGWSTSGFMRCVRGLLPDFDNCDYAVVVPDLWRITFSYDSHGDLRILIEVVEVICKHMPSAKKLSTYAWMDEHAAEYGHRIKCFVRDTRALKYAAVDLNAIYEAEFKAYHAKAK